MLFPSSKQRSKERVPDRDRPRRRIATGTLRLMESSAERLARANTETWAALVDAIRRSAAGRLELLRGRDGHERVSCPWERLITCDANCRCRGAGTVTVDFLRGHYTQLAVEIAKAAMPVSSRRTS